MAGEPDDRLDGWKAIARALGRDERTAMRWRATRGLPVQNVPGGARGTVFAYRHELDAWLTGAAARPDPRPPEATTSPPPPEPPSARLANTPPPARAPFFVQRVINSSRWLGAGAIALLALIAATGTTRLWSEPVGSAIADPDPVAQDLYLRGRHQWALRTPASLAAAVSLFGEAIARDPRGADAYAGLADTYLLQREHGTLPDREAWPRAEAAADAALALRPNLPAAIRAKGYIAFWWHRRQAEGLDAMRRAVALAPADPQSHHWLATALSFAGDHEGALAAIEQARRLAPDQSAILADRGLLLWLAGQHDAGVAVLRELLSSEPANSAAHGYLAEALIARGHLAGYLRETAAAARLRGDRAVASAAAAALQAETRGGTPAGRAVLARAATAGLRAGTISAFAAGTLFRAAGEEAATRAAMAVASAQAEPRLPPR